MTGSRRQIGILSFHHPIPGEQFMQPIIGRAARDYRLQHIRQPSLWIEPIQFRRVDQRR